MFGLFLITGEHREVSIVVFFFFSLYDIEKKFCFLSTEIVDEASKCF